ncbi:unnamed protein product [Adineta steineri]|uniref:GH16 domain-containing protein n=2 Tax=Adineta steineri TaxID=433720 RepID=A0A814JQ08_9BILA|nr:unnamed protein product [Adineta steineri]CAF4241167.1 unnamed protein product [Adineta steineri]
MRILLISLVYLLVVSYTDTHPTDGLALTFSEQFNPPALNTSVWNYGYPWGSYHNHRANTVPRQAKITPEGYLNITAIRERTITLGTLTDFGPIDLDFTSGAVNTNGKFCIKNGYVEVNLRASDVQSTWPSVYLIGEDQTTVPMITIMEVFNSRSRFTYGFRYANDQATAEDESYTADNRETSSGFHRFGVDWGYDQITWYYDDQWVNTIAKSNELKQVDNMCLVISFGVGGKSKDTPIDPRAYPTLMSVDWIEMWQPKYDGFYKFENTHNGFVMEIESASTTERARVMQWHDNGGDWQKWHVQYAGHGQYRIFAAHSRQALDAYGWQTNNGAPLIQAVYHAGDNQLWKINEVDGSPGVVQLISVHSLNQPGPGKLVSVPASSTDAGIQLHLWEEVNNADQKWKMIRL